MIKLDKFTAIELCLMCVCAVKLLIGQTLGRFDGYSLVQVRALNWSKVIWGLYL